MNREPNNADRALWARNALTVFTVETFGGDDPSEMDSGDLENAICDLITDLLHLADQQGFDADEVLRSATFHYEAEKYEEARP